MPFFAIQYFQFPISKKLKIGNAKNDIVFPIFNFFEIGN